ncbi:SAM-dependent methyltransferase [archaeon]|nr:MAG: SAM-dependent methyltransferase [archaeon]
MKVKVYENQLIWALLAALVLQGSVVWGYVLPRRTVGLRKFAMPEYFELQRPPEVDTFMQLVLSSLDSKNPSLSSLKFKDNALLAKSSLDRDGVNVSKHIKCKLVEIKKWRALALQVHFAYTTNDQVKNYKSNEVEGVLYDVIHQYGFAKATLLLVDGQQHTLTIKRDKDSNRIISCNLLTMHNKPQGAGNPVSYEHDRSKNYVVPVTEPYLLALNITYLDKKSNSLKVRAEAIDKFVQINKFTETVWALLQKYEGNGNLEVVDMGCGKGYLTFAIHNHLQRHLLSVRTTGIEIRPRLVQEMNRVVSSQKIDALNFIQGSITDFITPSDAPPSLFTKSNSTKVLVALHACDTATDDAMFLGIQSNADVMILSPCCHKQLRAQLDKLATKPTEQLASTGLDAMLKFGILRERSTEILTDTIRALCLQIAGYDVKVFEFVDAEHTAKNVMITAVKKEKQITEASMQELLSQLMNLLRTFDVSQHQLLKHMQLRPKHSDLDNHCP